MERNELAKLKSSGKYLLVLFNVILFFRDIGRNLSRTGRELGCNINPSPHIISINKRSYQIRVEDVIKELEKCKGCDLVVVVIPDSGEVYGNYSSFLTNCNAHLFFSCLTLKR